MLLTHATTQRPAFSQQQADALAQQLYGIRASIKPLPSERDQGFYLQSDSGPGYVLKIANAGENQAVLDLQNKAMAHLAQHGIYCPRVYPTLTGEDMATVTTPNNSRHFVRLLSYLPGTPLVAIKPHKSELLQDLGRFLGHLNQALQDFRHPASHRDFHWDLKNAVTVIRRHGVHIQNPQRRALIEGFLTRFEDGTLPVLTSLRTSVIHNDANDHNLLVANAGSESEKISGIIDFGDMLHSYTVAELAVACAYAMLDKPDPLKTAAWIVSGYHQIYSLMDQELELLYPLIGMRLCLSVTLAAYQQKQTPDNPYLAVSEQAAWALLERLNSIHPQLAWRTFRQACKLPPCPQQQTKSPQEPNNDLPPEEILRLRRKHLGPSLSIAYRQPLKIIRGAGQYLYDHEGRAYLDAVNNVCHVGHCHPRVVRAAHDQMAVLNTNTRYLHDNVVRYAQRLCATLPEPLSICFFVCSGSEANELALRMARAHTGQYDVIVIDGAYHGNTSALIELSPYKFDGPGGSGAPSHIHKVIMPDGYRGPYKYSHPQAGEQYAEHVRQAIPQHGFAAFIAESLLGCGGQIVLPDAYLQAAYRHVRKAGGVCIADEVQVGFGRVGSHFWGFQTQGVVPDIVTLGKPMGNGHPLAAVITTPEIAASFDTGMEYFNTYGGNPVSCAVGLAVLDVIEDEGLQQHALQVGEHLKTGLRTLMDGHPLIGDVRGLGLFLGVELVLDRETLEPAPAQAAYVVERLKDHGILLSTDGPLHNVLKIKPPLVFSEADAERLVNSLDKILEEDFLQPQ